MIYVYGYMPAWGLPDISPYVTKLINYLTFAGIDFEHRAQDLSRLDEDTPHGKLPMILDGDTKVADSNVIIGYLKGKYGDTLDKGMSMEEQAAALAFNRMIEEHLYWSGIIQPRWRQDEGFQLYVPVLVQGAEVTPPLRQFLDDFRARIVAEFNGQGMGRRDATVVLKCYQADIDALSTFLGDKKYFFGDKIRSIDASVYSILRHCSDHPQTWLGTGYIQTKGNLVAYMNRIRKEYNI